MYIIKILITLKYHIKWVQIDLKLNNYQFLKFDKRQL